MVRSKLRNRFLKSKTSESMDKYKRQKNYCVGLLRKVKQNYYENLNVKVINDNITFWKTIKPLFSDKNPTNSKITLMEDKEIVSDNGKYAELMNTLFSDFIVKLEIDGELHNENVVNIKNPVAKAIERYKNHPIILKLNENTFGIGKFHFQPISVSTMQRVIQNMDSSKTFQSDNIPPKILNQNDDICSGILVANFKTCIA